MEWVIICEWLYMYGQVFLTNQWYVWNEVILFSLAQHKTTLLR